MPDALQDEARIWLARLAAADVTQMDVQAFKRWQSTSAAHQAAFEQAKVQWQALRPALGELLRVNPRLAARHERLRDGTPRHGRRAFLGAAMGAAAVAGVAVAYPPLGLWAPPGEWGADFHTATGEQREVLLAQRVSLTLNTQTRVRRQPMDGDTLGVALLSGEAAIDLAGEGPSFNVLAGAGRSLAQAGRFEVRYLGERVCVTCVEGLVHVTHPAGQRQLQTRQQLIYDARAISGIASVDANDISAWRRGLLVFRQTPLVQAVAEINRYRRGRVMLASTPPRDSAISGRFSIESLDEALVQIQHSFGLRAQSLPGGLLVLT